MSSKAPPVPPENRSPKGTGDEKLAPREDRAKASDADLNTSQQGRQGNISQNTANQGRPK